MSLYKNPKRGKKIYSAQNDQDGQIENKQIQFQSMLNQLSQYYGDAESLYKNIEFLYNIDPLVENNAELHILDMIIKSNITEILFNYARANFLYGPPFIKYILWLSKIDDSEKLLNPPLISYLISCIHPINNNISLMVNVSDILSNFSSSNAKIASIIIQFQTIQYFDEILQEIRNKLEDNKDLVISILSFFGTMLNIEKFQPINYFPQIINAGFYFIFSTDIDIFFQSLELLYNASNPFHSILFKPIISQRLDVIHRIFLYVDNDDEEISECAFEFMINVTSQMDNNDIYKFFELSQLDLLTHLQNSINIDRYNLTYVLQFICNMIEPKKEKNGPRNTPIFNHFISFSLFIINQLKDEDQIEMKIVVAQTFSKITEIAGMEQNIDFIHNTAFIHNLCSLFGVEQEIDYDLLCALNNLIKAAALVSLEECKSFINSIFEVISIEQLENLFDEPEDSIYEIMRDEVVNRLKKINEKISENEG